MLADPNGISNTLVQRNLAEKIGEVISRPTGELKLLWELYAASLDRQEKMQRELNRQRKAERKRQHEYEHG